MLSGDQMNYEAERAVSNLRSGFSALEKLGAIASVLASLIISRWSYRPRED